MIISILLFKYYAHIQILDASLTYSRSKRFWTLKMSNIYSDLIIPVLLKYPEEILTHTYQIEVLY